MKGCDHPVQFKAYPGAAAFDHLRIQRDQQTFRLTPSQYRWCWSRKIAVRVRLCAAFISMMIANCDSMSSVIRDERSFKGDAILADVDQTEDVAFLNATLRHFYASDKD